MATRHGIDHRQRSQPLAVPIGVRDDCRDHESRRFSISTWPW
jgi:hypothetical protein